jgi:hypothetical protein
MLDEDSSLQDMKELRKDVNESYSFLLKVMVPCVIGRTMWKKSAHLKKVSELSGWIDEAFALIVLENYWEKWWAIAKMDVNALRTIRAKWTEEGKGTNASKHSGWTKVGLDVFSGYCNLVHEERTKNEKRSTFEDWLLIEYLKEYEETAGGKNRKKACCHVETYECEDMMDTFLWSFDTNEEQPSMRARVEGDTDSDTLVQI